MSMIHIGMCFKQEEGFSQPPSGSQDPCTVKTLPFMFVAPPAGFGQFHMTWK